MIFFVMTDGHEYTVKPIVQQTLGPAVPPSKYTTYARLMDARRCPAATYIFVDLERLTPFELRLAAQVYQAMVRSGLRCLNNPALVLTRRELLRRLYVEGINPFNAYPADMMPRPERFPVFVRPEEEHGGEPPPLLQDQDELDSHLSELRRNNVPLRGLLVVEYAAEPIAPGIWRRFGTFNIGGRLHMNHTASQDRWHVSQGTRGLATEEMFHDEHAAIAENRFSSELRPIFELARIEYGRADHATFQGRQIVYEINTNPALNEPSPQRSPIRDEALALSRVAIAESLWAIDTGDGSLVDFCDRRELSARREHMRKGRYVGRP
jgi:hypothetical protein